MLIITLLVCGLSIEMMDLFYFLARRNDVKEILQKIDSKYSTRCWVNGLSMLWTGESLFTQFYYEGKKIDTEDEIYNIDPFFGVLTWLLRRKILKTVRRRQIITLHHLLYFYN